MRKSSDMVVLDEDKIEWLVPKIMLPLLDAYDNAEKDKICLKSLLVKSKLDPKTAEVIEELCRTHEKKHQDEMENAIEVVMSFLVTLLSGVPLSIENISRLKEFLTEEQIKFLEANISIKFK